jgi:predicted AlkP superfamily pyrophosphatase or phosphodiesterase
MNIFNIPFRYLRYFKKAGVCAYEDEFSHPTVLTRMNGLKKALYSRYSSVGDRDKYVFEEAKEAIDADIYQNIFVASADLDHLTHRVGVGSGEHRKKIASLDKQLKEICLLFAKKNPDGNICVFSDHGMANTTKSVTIDLEKVFGRANEDRYIYFIDSTMLRIWVFDKGLEKEIKSYLKNLDYGKSLNQDERKKFGIVSKEFGSIIFLLNEGIVFCPSFFGKSIPKAMHGYHPELASQLGMFLLLKSDKFIFNNTKMSTKGIYSVLKRVCYGV